MSEASKFFLTTFRTFSLAKSFKPSQITGETQVILACAFNNKLIFLRAISPPPTTRHGFCLKLIKMGRCSILLAQLKFYYKAFIMTINSLVTSYFK